MFGLLRKRTEVEKLELQYEKLMEEARDIQRKGDMKAFALKTAEAEAVMDALVRLKQTQAR
ncbi:hypothetical protein SAMN05421823_106111 [Catalinimonas alkaloidigena]|uniref:Lacal_2735 family protein n=1 Tax=Catalinimonas alkaloidigena TaxID=1075417 RepID=A0A1G9KBP9_9BACT|nr:Lacal_2735 family protein [Catalinimonas alkaloidigena]SDL47046.1 hypothetical protein SAMN05421823_106111 [Catalinimonas alkaloidigena]